MECPHLHRHGEASCPQFGTLTLAMADIAEVSVNLRKTDDSYKVDEGPLEELGLEPEDLDALRVAIMEASIQLLQRGRPAVEPDRTVSLPGGQQIRFTLVIEDGD